MALVLAWLSHAHYDSLPTLFASAKIDKSKQQLKFIAAIAYQLSIFVLGNVFIMFLLTSIVNVAYDHYLVMALRRNISNSLEQFIIFIGLFAYIITNDKSTDK